jgi:hypothetical protein
MHQQQRCQLALECIGPRFQVGFSAMEQETRKISQTVEPVKCLSSVSRLYHVRQVRLFFIEIDFEVGQTAVKRRATNAE